ncbi:MAG: polymer-forming cytoskeletal protein [Gammaproteobacteria bacterium]|nr:polymer-forming cytoskeletal protein [Gammaproteobacteria bacterium]
MRHGSSKQKLVKWFRLEGREALNKEGVPMKRTKKNRVDSRDNSTTLVASGTSVRGDIQFSGRLYISGAVTGSITTEKGAPATLVVDEDGRVEGDIQATHVIIAGRVDGNVIASERLEVAATARVSGDVSYRQLGVELGGLLNGKLLLLEGDESRGNVRVFELSGGGDRDA